MRLLVISQQENDAAWKAARGRLDLREPPQNGLGYGGSGRSGSSRPQDIREAILRTSKEIIELGAAVSAFDACEKYNLPAYVDSRQRRIPIVLVPRDIVRELPLANDWSDIERAALENARIRDRVNRYLGGLARPTVADRKSALREAALGSADDFNLFLNVVKENVSSYDPNLDALGYYKIKEIFAHGFEDLKQNTKYEIASGADEIVRLVNYTIDLFKRHVEKGNLWEELWISGKPKKERASQLIYYAIADAFCKANNVDISPEANMGGGPIDFKFSSGYHARVLVEMKRSNGTVVHGYEKQLEFYKGAAQTDYGLFVIINYGDLGDKLRKISDIRGRRLANGERASDIIVIDATQKASASKRK